MAGPPSDLFGLVGTILDGQYRVDAVVGHGGFGVVYRGFHLTFEQPVAIKVLKLPELDAPTQNHILGKFREEAKLQYVLSQASLNVVRSIGFGALNTPSGAWAPFVVLEWLEGRSLAADLSERLEQGRGGRTLPETHALLEPAARGLIAAHHQHVAHRDVKPANFFLTHTNDVPPTPTMKVLDFGIAKIILDDAAAAQPTAFMSFTPFYAAPEQLDTRLGATGLHTDVYSFALVFVEVLTGKPPLDAREVMQIVMEATDRARRPTPRARGATVPDAVESVLARALAVDPRARHADVEQMWEALTKAAATARPAATLEIPSAKARGAYRGVTQALPSSGPMPAANIAATAAAPTAHLGTPPPGAVAYGPPPQPAPQPPRVDVVAPPWAPPQPAPRPYVWGPPPVHPAAVPDTGVHWAVWAGVAMGAVFVVLIIVSILLKP